MTRNTCNDFQFFFKYVKKSDLNEKMSQQNCENLPAESFPIWKFCLVGLVLYLQLFWAVTLEWQIFYYTSQIWSTISRYYTSHKYVA